MGSAKSFLIAGSLFFGALALATTFGFWPPAWDDAARYFTSDQLDRSARYRFQVYLFHWAGVFLNFAFLCTLVFTSWGPRLTETCRRWARGRWLGTVCLLFLVLFILERLLYVPLSIARLYHRRAWEITHRDLGDWLGDWGKSLAEGGLREGVLVVGFYVLARWFPRRWWLPAATVASLFVVGYVMIKPTVIDPLFNTFTPLYQTKWANLEPRFRALVAKANVEVGDILVMDASTYSTHSNAYFTGFGHTRRIVLYDNLLEKHPPEEVETIVAHELGHWLHNHIVVGVALASAGFFLGTWILARILTGLRGRPPLHLQGPADPVGMPLIFLIEALSMWAIAPVQNAVSRHFERQADEMSLKLAGQPEVFIAAEKRLAIDNLSNLAPTPWEVWLYFTHPPVVERIGLAERWKAEFP